MLKRLLLIALVIAFSCDAKKERASANIVEISSSGVFGKAIFKKMSNGIKLTVTLAGKKNTTVAAHIHSGNKCDYIDGSEAMGHWNPTGETHGYWGTESFHSGDLGNIELNNEGKGKLVVFDNNNRWSLEKIGKKDVTGKTIIIHSGYDDGTSQPSGNAGSRVGCGVITPVFIDK